MCKHLNTKKITLWRNARMAAHLLMCHQFQQLLHPDASVVPLVQQWLLQEDYYPYHHLHRSPLLQPLPFATCTAQHTLPAGQANDDVATEWSTSNTGAGILNHAEVCYMHLTSDS
jgi:hypothetical protein